MSVEPVLSGDIAANASHVSVSPLLGLVVDSNSVHWSVVKTVPGEWPTVVILLTRLSILAVIIAIGIRLLTTSDPLSGIPGPLLARWTPFWLAYQARRGRRYLAVDDLHKKYGRLVRIAPNHVSVSDKDALSIVYGQGIGAFDKSQFYHAFVCDKASVFSTTDRQEHSQKRRLVSQAFSANSLSSFTPYIHDVLGEFVHQMDTLCEGDKPIDLLVWFNYLAFDVLSELAFGEAIGMVKQGSDLVPVESVDGRISYEHAIELVDEREHLAAVVGIHPLIKFLANFAPDPFFIRGRKSSSGLIDLGRRKVKKRLTSGTQRDDILGRLLHARGSTDGVMTSSQIDELTAEAVTLLIAGSDTTSNSVTAIIHLVMTHPAVYSRLMSELEEKVDTSTPEYHHLKDIPYLEAVIDEGLRIYATTAIGLHRAVPQGGAYCCDRFFPEGTEMSVPAWTIQHDAGIWGDPEVFRPERWLDVQSLRPYLLTFGKGPRACLGRNLAYMEMRLILATVLLRYKVTLLSNELETTEGFMHKPLKLMAHMSRRKKD